ncbi:MAG: hypothetical protein DDT19_00254 [Syntrophomonadaceae bacterium]|nr:hypothetical protein [Bacillota bacterium]
MKYRLTYTLFFDLEKDAKNLHGKLKSALAKATNVGSGPNQEKSVIELHQCFHDESPPRPCILIERVER